MGLKRDGAPAIYSQKSRLVGRIQEKMREEDAGELTAYDCIKHQKALCGKALQMEYVMSYIKQVVNFIRAKGLNHRSSSLFWRSWIWKTEMCPITQR